MISLTLPIVFLSSIWLLPSLVMAQSCGPGTLPIELEYTGDYFVAWDVELDNEILVIDSAVYSGCLPCHHDVTPILRLSNESTQSASSIQWSSTKFSQQTKESPLHYVDLHNI